MGEEKTGTTAAEFIKTLPSFAWIVLAASIFYFLFVPIRDLSYAVAARVKSGARAELGPLKLEEIRVTARGPSRTSSKITVTQDKSLSEKLDKVRKDTQDYYVAHRLYPSEKAGQTYDIWIYVVPFKKTIDDIKSASYYFGSGPWGDRVFTSLDRGKSFGIVVSAYGPMLAHVTIELKTGEKIESWSYIDFENGALGDRGGV